ncbi:XS domain-containing protein/zf-XS domain-containing protein [Cephalotus follicularis]|uniref:XS domain-containing protein/zf-XS domain-containing protein n=1 Tax=Cephalotus follicularis TaxID=3775 RepID=A0A1Q3AMW1_CEPFO|nr:XS domain-containing protein/zf-XS domain-containing protein [Cephalotus follicularis]
MSSRRGGCAADTINNSSSSKGKCVSEPSATLLDQFADMGLDDGQWEEVSGKKSKNRAGSTAAKPRASHITNPKAWDQPDKLSVRGNSSRPGRAPGNTRHTQAADSKAPIGRGSVRPQSSVRPPSNNYMPSQLATHPPLEHGWNWQSRPASIQFRGSENGQLIHDEIHEDKEIDDGVEDNDSDAFEDTDEELFSDDFDSDASQKSHETRKKSKWFKIFFELLDTLTVEQINEPLRQWHCPACQGGPGAIDWYRGLQPLMTHAKTKGAKRVKPHRELAELLDEELRRRGTSVVPAGEVFGKWKGLKDEEKDHDIIWPPMVVIMNTRLEQDENDKWIGMGNQELLDYFSSYDAVRARHSYGPDGHRGMSVLIFEASANGYLEAERLHKHFAEQGTNRDAWNRCQVLFHPGGKRQLYGYMAKKEDLDIFNKHSQGKSKLKFEMRSYQEMVVKQLRKMSEDNQQLMYWKDKVDMGKRHTKAIEESFGILSAKLRKTMEENRIVRHRTKMQHEQNKEEMDYQEEFFRDQLKVIHKERDAREEDFELLQQQERERVRQSIANPSDKETYIRRAEEVEKFIQIQDKEMADFVAGRDKLIKLHEEKIAAMKQRHREEEVALEKEFDTDLTCLMEQYTPHGSEVVSGCKS